MVYYHDGMRELQDRYEGRTIADRLAANRMRTRFNDEDRAFIETSPLFFSFDGHGRKCRLLAQGRRPWVCPLARRKRRRLARLRWQ